MGGVHVDAPGICRARYPHPCGAHICTRPQSQPNSWASGWSWWKQASRWREPVGGGAGRTRASAWGVWGAWLPLIPHPHPWPAALLLCSHAVLLPGLVHGPAGLPRPAPAPAWQSPPLPPLRTRKQPHPWLRDGSSCQLGERSLGGAGQVPLRLDPPTQPEGL